MSSAYLGMGDKQPSNDHKEIWLQPECCDGHNQYGDEKLWSEDGFFNCECPADVAKPAVRYVRADLSEELEERLEMCERIITRGAQSDDEVDLLVGLNPQEFGANKEVSSDE